MALLRWIYLSGSCNKIERESRARFGRFERIASCARQGYSEDLDGPVSVLQRNEWVQFLNLVVLEGSSVWNLGFYQSICRWSGVTEGVSAGCALG